MQSNATVQEDRIVSESTIRSCLNINIASGVGLLSSILRRVLDKMLIGKDIKTMSMRSLMGKDLKGLNKTRTSWHCYHTAIDFAY